MTAAEQLIIETLRDVVFGGKITSYRSVRSARTKPPTFDEIKDALNAFSGISTSLISAVSVNGHVTDIVPAGYMLKAIIFKNNDAHAVVVSVGTTEAGIDVVDSLNIPARGNAVATINNLWSFTAAKTLYLSSADWNGTNLDVYVLLEKVLVGTDATYVPTSS